MAETKLLEIKIIVNEHETREGKKFNAYKAVQSNGKLIDVRFVKDVKNTPDENCIIKVLPENVNIDKNRQFPCLWVKKIEDVVKPTYKNVEDELKDMFSTHTEEK